MKEGVDSQQKNMYLLFSKILELTIMETTTQESRYNVILHLPVKITYKVLETYLQKKLLGKILSKGKADGSSSDTARIQNIKLERSMLDDYDLAVHLQLGLLTTFFKNKEIRMTVHLAISFREASQEIMISHYKLEGENNGWFINTAVETLINNFLYSKLKEKMKFDIRPVVTEKLQGINNKLTNGFEVAEGINLTGKVNEFRVKEVIPGQRTLLVTVNVMGNNVLNIQKIDL